MHAVRSAAVLLLLGIALTVAAPAALADGDPASDILPGEDVFLPYGTVDSSNLSPADKQLVAAVTAANRSGYRIKVAVISSAYDLGAVTGLFGKPQTYARFLGQELGFIYHGPLLIAMANGFGLYDGGRSVSRESRLLRSITIARDASGLQEAATAGVAKLAAAAGHPIKVPALKAGGTSADPAVIGGAGAALLVFIAGITVLWRGRYRLGKRGS